jgi:hypothetical protein
MLLDQKPQRCCALLMPWHCLMQKFGQIFSARGFEPACCRFRAGEGFAGAWMRARSHLPRVTLLASALHAMEKLSRREALSFPRS